MIDEQEAERNDQVRINEEPNRSFFRSCVMLNSVLTLIRDRKKDSSF
ncbi:hypothetical protein [Allocoleopsis franciscana]|uniref:Uncharacterized protein n=1 Tax=Allocoleopsis franciscana PCC 7113 TaxID=1173027 RepID=K9WMN9_9CYAN|nr:hypothetical protein [Allocoleopsis franciscana]AFZ21665.1 hypothetical protein Mic7113_6066 [Allocoleopsis franciscana PCC 7113]